MEKSTRKEWLLAGAITLASVGLVLSWVRWQAPELLGRPADLRLVQVAETKPAFYDGVFSEVARTAADSFIVNDPVVVTRGRGLFLTARTEYGPNDILGFRNNAVPIVSDVVVLGDSQTYGNNVPMGHNWPSLVANQLGDQAPSGVYSMAIGGWSAPQYGVMIEHALAFRPRAVVLALYSGNDALESFVAAYGNDRFADLRLDSSISAADAPEVAWPPPEDEWWTVAYAPGKAVTFTPKFRHLSNDRSSPSIRAGLQIMSEVVRRMAKRLGEAKVPLIVTIVPTKELAFTRFLSDKAAKLPDEFSALIEAEQENIRQLREDIERIPEVTFVDVVDALQEEARRNPDAYSPDRDGHPQAGGYAAIAASLAPAIARHLPAPPRGLVSQDDPDVAAGYMLRLIADGHAWTIADQEVLAANGWQPTDTIPTVSARDIAGFPHAGVLRDVDPARFGPQAGSNLTPIAGKR